MRAVTIDIGGGSTEITLGTAARMEAGRSFKLGVIRLAERFAEHDPLSRGDVERLDRHIRRETGGLSAAGAAARVSAASSARRAPFWPSGMIAAGGAPAGPRDVRRLIVSARRHPARCGKRLVTLPLEERLQLSGLDPRRADLAPVGRDSARHAAGPAGRGRAHALRLRAARGPGARLHQAATAAHIRTAERYPDVRRRSVIELGERCSYLPDHAESGRASSRSRCFDATRTQHELGPREREWLEFGALLHDIGTHISYDAHHKHSYYLIRHGELRGFDPEEVEVIGLVARYHRQATPKKSHEGFAALPRALRRTVKLLGALVRLAEGLDRSHAQVVRRRRRSRRATTACASGCKTAGDAELELWAATRHAAPLARLLGMDITFEARRGAQGRGRLPGRPRSPQDRPAASPEFTASKRPRNKRRARVTSR